MTLPARTTPQCLWRWSVAWNNPYTKPTREHELQAVDVEPGIQCPPELYELAKRNPGYGVHWNYTPAEPKRWSPERKAKARRANLERRLKRDVPLFADEMRDRALARQPDYFEGK